VLLLVTAFAYAHARSDGTPISGGELSGLRTLNAAQRETVDKFLREYERRAGELNFLADRNGINVRFSASLRHLFPGTQFVAVPWIFRADPASKNFSSIPDGFYTVLAVSDEGQQESSFHSSGNHEEFGLFLHAHRVKVRNRAMADEVAMAYTDIYGLSMCCDDVRHSPSEWHLGYREMPFRPISSYEEVREAYYYRLTVDSVGVVLNGTYVCETLERRKIEKAKNPLAIITQTQPSFDLRPLEMLLTGVAVEKLLPPRNSRK
jgi:hypothetical protein